ncbi:MAG: efflux RND transporter periplasmic adaptor subunit [Parachlamydia sp.]|nr:efflux RND transporter periplasmic adaptor subunit [Parachlamydia sp.]
MATQPLFPTLPLFRKDLKLYRGPNDPDGSPTYNLLDPLKGQYYKIQWKESLLLRHLRPGMSAEDLANRVSFTSSIKVSSEEIEKFFMQASALDLVRIARTSEYFTALHERRKVGFWLWLLYHYLYIRIPLLNPDNFLARTLHYVLPFASRAAFTLYAITTLLGLSIVLSRSDQFLHTFTYFFNLQGLIFYAIAISVVKLIHEFSHAYVAKYYGLHVPTMGVAFIVLWPVLYTDVTDGWKLSKRSQRFAVSFAGIAAETIVAGMSTLGWALSQPGLMQSTFFVLASTSWISTLLININPAVRFDGYYMLCDLWGIDNLQNRAFAVARWKYFDWFLGIKTPCPEEGFSPQRLNWMAIFSVYTWIYRFLLYTAIAVFVYYEFTKALGILLFIAEIAIFFVWPVVSEAKEIYMARSLLHWNPRLILTLTAISLFAAWFILPLPHKIDFDAVVMPSKYQVLYSPELAYISQIHVKRDDHIEQGQPLIEFSSKSLLKDLLGARASKEMIEKQLLYVRTVEGQESHIGQKQAELAQANASLSAYEKRQNRLVVHAEITGTLVVWDDTLRLGQYLPRGQTLGKIVDLTDWEVLAYVPDRYVDSLHPGERAKIEISYPFMWLEGLVEKVVPFRSELVSNPSLASIYHGPLPSVEIQFGQQPTLMGSYYLAYIRIQSGSADLQDLHEGQLAVVRVRGPWRSKLGELMDAIVRIFLRESSL